MRKLMTALIFSLVMAGLAAPSGAAIAKPDADQALILKKKKRLATLKAAAKAEEQALAKAEAAAKARKKLAATAARSKKAVRIVRTDAARIKPTAKQSDRLLAAHSAQPRRDCGSFLKCLFAKKQRPVRVASIDPNFTGGASGLSGRTMRETVDFSDGKYKPGSIIVRTAERALYYVLPGGEAIRYSVGVGREGFQWGGKSTIVRKQEWPSWTPPQVMIEREAAKGHIIPPFMEGGPGNPLGARAMYIGGTMFRVHGTNNEASIGGAVSSGCIRMMNTDVVDLYDRVRVGAPIHVIQ
jgi:lipoprotein-anchoring transpeptidase ErfK/SrfK